jgi:putative addiction module antidote
MAMQIELKKIGNSSGFILPKEAVAELRLIHGDRFTVTTNADGSITLRRADPVFERGMEIARKAMETYRNTLEELAK